MILKMNTNLLPLVNPGLYGTILGEYYADVPQEDNDSFKKLLCYAGEEIMNELLKDEEIIIETLGIMEVSDTTFHSPRFYNFENDWFNFNLEVPDDVAQKIIDSADEDFFNWIYKTYCSRDGFISFMPYTKEKYSEAIHGKDLERAVAMYITYLVKCGAMCYSLETYQRDLEDEMDDICLQNEWYDPEEMEVV